jgi:hypothetical protein
MKVEFYSERKYMQQADIFGDLRIHRLKCWTEYFNFVANKDIEKRKNFEVRKYDRDYQVGDYLLLSAYDPKEDKYTDRYVWRQITYILHDNRFLPEDIVVMGLIDNAPKLHII